MAGTILVTGGSKDARNSEINKLTKDIAEDSIYKLGREGDKKSIGIAQTKELSKVFQTKTKKGQKRVIIIEEADALTEEAQNSLLKLLEEHDESLTIILGAKKENSLLQTVLSRCKKVKVPDGVGERKDDENKLSKIRSFNITQRFTWTQETAKEEKEVVIDILEGWVLELRSDLNNAENVELIELLLKLIKDLEETNIGSRIALDYFLTQI